MKILTSVVIAVCLAGGCFAENLAGTAEDRAALLKTTQAIRDAFARGDVPAIVALHHPNVIKYFGGTKVVNGRVALTSGLIQTFKSSQLEFIENRVESTVFLGDTAVETSIFAIRATPKHGGAPTVARGRAMVVYVRFKDSPTGWASIREMAQAAPDEPAGG